MKRFLSLILVAIIATVATGCEFRLVTDDADVFRPENGTALPPIAILEAASTSVPTVAPTMMQTNTVVTPTASPAAATDIAPLPQRISQLTPSRIDGLHEKLYNGFHFSLVDVGDLTYTRLEGNIHLYVVGQFYYNAENSTFCAFQDEQMDVAISIQIMSSNSIKIYGVVDDMIGQVDQISFDDPQFGDPDDDRCHFKIYECSVGTYLIVPNAYYRQVDGSDISAIKEGTGYLPGQAYNRAFYLNDCFCLINHFYYNKEVYTRVKMVIEEKLIYVKGKLMYEATYDWLYREDGTLIQFNPEGCYFMISTSGVGSVASEYQHEGSLYYLEGQVIHPIKDSDAKKISLYSLEGIPLIV